MADIQGAAGRLGVSLNARLVRCADLPSDRPVMIYLKVADEGHYVVAAPVGTCGTMVQLFDSPHDPIVIDRDALCLMNGWTGRVLILRKWTDMTVPALFSIVGVAAGLGVLQAVWSSLRRRLATRALSVGGFSLATGAGSSPPSEPEPENSHRRAKAVH